MDIIRIDSDFTPETHTIGAESAQSSAITTQSGIIRIAITGTHAHVKFGTNPTATEEDIICPENTVQYFSFISGHKVAFIKSGDGNGQINICAVD